MYNLVSLLIGLKTTEYKFEKCILLCNQSSGFKYPTGHGSLGLNRLSTGEEYRFLSYYIFNTFLTNGHKRKKKKTNIKKKHHSAKDLSPVWQTQDHYYVSILKT